MKLSNIIHVRDVYQAAFMVVRGFHPTNVEVDTVSGFASFQFEDTAAARLAVASWLGHELQTLNVKQFADTVRSLYTTIKVAKHERSAS